MWEEFKMSIGQSFYQSLICLSKPEVAEEEVTFGARARYGKRVTQQELSDGYCRWST